MPLKWMLILNFILVLTSITIAIFFIRCRRQYFGHTWMRNIHWTNMKYICPVHPVKRGLCLVILFLILGICFLSAQAATGEISDHTDPLPHPTNANCNANDWIQIFILIVVVLIFFISAINLFISYKLNHREQHDPEGGPLLEDHGNVQETMIELQIHNGKLQENNRDLQEKLNQLQNELEKLQDENGQLKSEKGKLQGSIQKLQDENGQLKSEKGKLQGSIQKLQDENGQLKSEKEALEMQNGQLEEKKKALETQNEWRKARNETDDITLDAGTAHPNLSIAGDKKSLKHEAQPQQVSYNPERFDSTVCVLGSEGFSSGKHYWEVDVRSSTDWDLGVARKSIQRQGKLSLSPKEGFWVLSLSGKDYWAKTDPWTRVVAQKKLQKIGVYLSYKEGQVTFFNVTDMSLLFRFNDCSFSGAVYPFFKNSHKETAMKICSIKEEE
ncbi:uncharacterized protein LOC141976721 [Natator depressus]|uniref:uncharacterized protein LOC141976721 n=1 Tax=Natator depressus TaxID=27790 RepID=UPI003EBE63E2